MSILAADDVTALINRLGGTTVLTAADVSLITGDVVPRAEMMVREHLGYSVEQATYTEYLPDMDYRQPESTLEARFLSPGYGYTHGVSNPVSELFVNEYPLRSVTSVYENQIAWETDPVNGDFSSGFLLTAGSDYTVDFAEPGFSFSGSLKRFGAWSPIRKSVKVTYVAGYTADELDSTRWRAIKEAVMLTAHKFYLDVTMLQRTSKKTSGFGIVTSEKLDDYFVQFNVESIKNLLGFANTLPAQAVMLLRKHVWVHKLLSR